MLDTTGDHGIFVTDSGGNETGNYDLSITSDDFTVIPPPDIQSIAPNISLPDRAIRNLTVTGTNLTGAIFTFIPEFAPPVMTVGAPTINPTGTSATMPLTIGPNAVDIFTFDLPPLNRS